MWIIALCLLTTPPVGILVWYLRRRWQWWMLYAAQRLLINDADTILIQRHPLVSSFSGRVRGLYLDYKHFKEDGHRLLSLDYGDGKRFVFSSYGRPRWKWICEVGDNQPEVAIPKLARRMLEDILRLVEARMETPLAHPEAKIKSDELPVFAGSDAA